MPKVTVLHDDIAEQVFNAVKGDMRRGARMAYGEHLSDAEAKSVVSAALWYCRKANPELSGDALRKEVIRLLYTEFSEYLIATRKYRQAQSKRGQHNIAKQLGDKIGTLPWGTPIGVEHGLVDYVESEDETDRYEKLIADLTVEDLLSRLIVAWKNPDLALAWVRFKAYGQSIPEILEVFGYSKEEMDKKEYNALRIRAWRHLSKLDDLAREALADEVGELQDYFVGDPAG